MFQKSTSPLYPFRWGNAPCILGIQYNSKIMEWPVFILSKWLHFIWSNTAGCLLGFLNVDSKLLLLQSLALIFKIHTYNSRKSESSILKFLIWEIMKVKNRRKNFNKQWKKCVQEKMAASWKCFEDQNYLTLYLIQFLRGGSAGVGQGSRQKKLLFSN